MSHGHALIVVITSIWNYMKKIVYVDMDNVLVDFQSAFPKLSKKGVRPQNGHQALYITSHQPTRGRFSVL